MKLGPKTRAQLAFNIVCKFFGGNVDKANHWFNTFNPKLGVVPVSLMKEGKIEMLVSWVKIHFDPNMVEKK